MASESVKMNPLANPESIIQGPNYRFTFLNEYITRYEWSEDGIFEDRASTMVVNRQFEKPTFQVYDKDNQLEIETPTFRMTYDKKRFSSTGLFMTVKSKLTLWGAQWNYGDIPASNLSGTARTLDGIDGRCDTGIGLLSRAGYSAIDDTSSMLFDGEGFVAPRRPGDRIDGYFFCYGLDFRGAIKSFYNISGHQPILPRWALGNWWSRYYSYTQQEYIDLMDKFQSRKVPLSVAVIDMDWHLVSDDRVPHTGWTGYTWNNILFPDPTQFGKELHKRKLKITLNDHPHSGIHHHEESYEEMSTALGRSSVEKQPIEFDPTDPLFMKAYMDVLHRNIEQVACDFWWIDWQQGNTTKIPGIDPLWLLNHFHFVDNTKSNPQGLIFSRYAGPGSHRYPIGFSGDSVATWESLKFQPEFTASASNIGFGWWSHDLGGHMCGYRDDEMVARWIQLGVFSPIFRLHSSNSRWCSKEPWLYRKEAQETIEDAMRLRHRLVPYLYSMNLRAAMDGEPLIQPMYWSYPLLDEAYEVPNQYLFGSELICVPITGPRNSITSLAPVTVWVPPGRHIDIFTGLVYDGNRKIQMYRPLHQLPVLAREGAILPLDAADYPENGCSNPNTFDVLVIVGANGKFEITEDIRDDTESRVGTEDAASNQRKSMIKFDQTAGKVKGSIFPGSWKFRILGLLAKEPRILLDGQAFSEGSISHTSYPDPPATIVSLSSIKKDTDLIIELGAEPQLVQYEEKEHISDIILKFQIEFSIKDRIWKIVNQSHAAGTKAASLMALKLPDYISEPIVEILCADSR